MSWWHCHLSMVIRSEIKSTPHVAYSLGLSQCPDILVEIDWFLSGFGSQGLHMNDESSCSQGWRVLQVLSHTPSVICHSMDFMINFFPYIFVIIMVIFHHYHHHPHLHHIHALFFSKPLNLSELLQIACPCALRGPEKGCCTTSRLAS